MTRSDYYEIRNLTGALAYAVAVLERAPKGLSAAECAELLAVIRPALHAPQGVQGAGEQLYSVLLSEMPGEFSPTTHAAIDAWEAATKGRA